MFRIRVPVILLATAILLSGSFPAYAYLDPGTGSMVTTAILGFFAAIIFTLRKYFYKVMRMFRSGGGGETSTIETKTLANTEVEKD